MPFGAKLLSDGLGVRFNLWAPTEKSVELQLFAEDGAASTHAAACDDQGWRTVVVADAGAGTRYQWRIDGNLNVPDPASRSNPDGVHAPSCVVDPSAFVWDADWIGRPWAEAVLYELHVGTFTPEGTFAGAQAQLQKLADLGVTAIELMPLSDFPGHFGWGYDGVLPFALHAAYGSPNELKSLIQAAHRLGVMVFIDVVYNHFGPDGNYLGAYAPDINSKSHTNPWGASLNFDGDGSVAVRQFFIHNALYWIEEYRFDGMRFDAIHAIIDDSPEHFVAELGRTLRERFPQRYVHLVLENENNGAEFLSHDSADRPEASYTAQWNDDFHHAMHVLLTGETAGYYGDYADRPIELVARALTHGFVWKGVERNATGGRVRLQYAEAQPLGAMVNYLTNHDQSGNRAFGERISALMPPAALPIATAVALLTPATPMIFFGDEFGATTPFLYFADWHGDMKKAVNEGRMREFGHVNAAAVGSAATHGIAPPPPCEVTTFHASKLEWSESDSAAGTAWRTFVAEMLSVRKRWIATHAPQSVCGGHSAQVGSGQALRVRWRYADGQALEMCVNLGAEAQPAVQPAWPALRDAHTVFEVGQIDAAQWAPWSGHWAWGREAD